MNFLNLVKENKDEILEELRDAAEIYIECCDEDYDQGVPLVEDVVWNYADDFTFEFVSVLSSVLDIEENEIEDIVNNMIPSDADKINEILFA